MHQGLVPSFCRHDTVGQFFMGFDYMNQGCSLLGVKGFPHKNEETSYVSNLKSSPYGEIVLETAAFIIFISPPPVEAHFK